MFPDASETSDFESSRQAPANGPRETGGAELSGRIQNPYFFRTLQNHPSIEKTIEHALSRFMYYSKIKNFIRREDTMPVGLVLDLFLNF